MSIQQHYSLTISGFHYSESELKAFAKNQISYKSLSQWKTDFFEFILDWLSGSSFIKVKTSGSTGAEKWIEIEKEKMVKSAQLTGRVFNLKKNDKALLCLPVNFIAGKMMVVRAMVLGMNLIPVEPSANLPEILNETFDFAAMTTIQVHNILNLKNGNQTLNQIKNLLIGGGEINIALLNKIEKLENNTYHTYGMTETITHVAFKKLNGKDSDKFFKALPGVRFEKDNRNCLVISASHLTNNKIITNDIVNLKAENLFEFIGRFDNIINSGGIKISPEKVEQELSSYIPNRFIIAGIPDEKFGQKLILILEGKPNQKIDFEQIFNKIIRFKYERPKEIFYIIRFPETESEKIKRKEVLKLILQSTNYK